MAGFPKHLIEGYLTFTLQRLPTEQTRYRELSERGQSPAVMVIGCCDSRVSPEVIFDAGPGELFVVRNVANLVPVYQPDGGAHGVSAALEYAVQVLRVKHVVVLGHAQCGGIRAFIDDIDPLSPGDFIGRWIQMFIKPGEMKSLLRQNGLEWKDHRGLKPDIPIPRLLGYLRKRARGEWTYAELAAKVRMVESRVTAVMYMGLAVKEQPAGRTRSEETGEEHG